MKKQLIMIASTIILSSTILGSLRVVTDQKSALKFESSPVDRAIESAQLSEDHNALPLTDNQSPRVSDRLQEQSINKFNESLGRKKTSINDLRERNSTDSQSTLTIC